MYVCAYVCACVRVYIYLYYIFYLFLFTTHVKRDFECKQMMLRVLLFCLQELNINDLSVNIRFYGINSVPLWSMARKPQLDIDVDIRPAIREAKKQFANLTGSQFNQGLARALNEVIDKSRTSAAKQMKSVYNVNSKDLKKQMKSYKATRSTLTASIRVSQRPMPLAAFSPRQTKKGVSVNILGKRKLIKGAFMAQMISGHKGVFARGRYVNREFVFRKTRVIKTGPDLPIDELVTVSPFSMLMNHKVTSTVAKKMESDFQPALIKQLNRVSAGF